MSKTVEAYFAAFNAGETKGMLACLADDVAHHVNEGQVRRGKALFAEFLRAYEPLLPRRADRYGGI